MKRVLVAAAFFGISMSALADNIPRYIGSSRSANSDPGIYLGGGIGGFGANKFKETDSYVADRPQGDPALVYNLFVGYKYNKYLRADINAQYRKLKYKAQRELRVFPIESISLNQKIKNFSIFANGYVDLPNYTIFTPYVTAGIGYSQNDSSNLDAIFTSPSLSGSAPGKKSNDFAWNLGVGTKIKVYENLDLDLSYRYADLGKIRHGAAKIAGSAVPESFQDLKVHQGIVSLIYNL